MLYPVRSLRDLGSRERSGEQARTAEECSRVQSLEKDRTAAMECLRGAVMEIMHSREAAESTTQIQHALQGGGTKICWRKDLTASSTFKKTQKEWAATAGTLYPEEVEAPANRLQSAADAMERIAGAMGKDMHKTWLQSVLMLVSRGLMTLAEGVILDPCAAHRRKPSRRKTEVGKALRVLTQEQPDRVVRLDMVAPPFGTILRDRQLVH